MNTRKLKLLPAVEFLKVSIPVIVLLCVFFFKSMIESHIDEIFSGKLSAVTSGFELNVEKSDADFIKALLESEDIKNLNDFVLSEYNNNPFLLRVYNERTFIEQPVISDVPEEVPLEQPAPPVKPSYAVTSVFNGSVKKYAVLNGNLVVQPGDSLSNGDRIVSIEDGRIKIEGQWGKQWFYVGY